jgi:hypothetical protein
MGPTAHEVCHEQLLGTFAVHPRFLPEPDRQPDPVPLDVLDTTEGCVVAVAPDR